MSTSDSCDDYHTCDSDSGSDENSCSSSEATASKSNTYVDYADYDESLEPVPNEQEAADYCEQLQEKEEREEFLLRRFSGEIDVTDW